MLNYNEDGGHNDDDATTPCVTGPIASVHVSDRVIQIWSDDQLREVCDYLDSIKVSYDLVIV